MQGLGIVVAALLLLPSVGASAPDSSPTEASGLEREGSAHVLGPKSAPRLDQRATLAAVPVAPRDDPRIIDTTDRDAVARAYLDRFLPQFDVAQGWTGSVSGCRPGTISSSFRTATLETVNYFRNLAGLPGATLSSQLNTYDQAAALIMDASGTLTHDPQPGAACYTEDGRRGASSSNLAIGSNPAPTGPRAIELYMQDRGSANTAAGHRRWVLFPPQTTLGTGSTDRADALHVLDSGSWVRPASGPDWITWPPPGFVHERHLYPRFSLSREGADFASATVWVTLDGATVPATVVSRTGPYGDPAIVFEPGVDWATLDSDRDHVFTVSVESIDLDGATTSHSWQTTTFRILPAAPADFGARATSPSKIKLTWTDGARETGYRIKCRTDGAWSVCKDGLPQGTTSHTLTGLEADTRYEFRPCAFNSYGETCASSLTRRTLALPGATPTPPPTTTAKRLVDDGKAGFTKWKSGWKKQGVGWGQRSLWMPVRKSSTWRSAQWKATLGEPGRYTVYVRFPRSHATTRSARYKIYHADGKATKVVDQYRRRGTWVKLGTYRFGATARVKLADKTGEKPSTKRNIVFDVVKFVPVASSGASIATVVEPEVPASEATPERTPTPETDPEPLPTPAPTPTPQPEPSAAPEPTSTPTPTPEPTPAPPPEPNRPPVADAGGPYMVEEGSTVRLDGRGSSDPDGDGITYDWSRPKRLDDPAARRPVFDALQDGLIEIELTVTDDSGAAANDTATIEVTNADPTIDGVESRRDGTTVTLEVAFSDPGPKDEHAVTVDWGDDTATKAEVAADSGTASHAYAEPGSYHIAVTVADGDGGKASADIGVDITFPSPPATEEPPTEG